MVEAEVKYFPCSHKRIFLVFCRKIQTLAFVSGDTLTEAFARLFADDPVWKTSRSVLGVFDVNLFEKAGLLDSSDLSNERHFIHHGKPKR